MAEASLVSNNEITVTETTQQASARSPNLVLKLQKPKPDKQVKWEQGTVDNEHMNKKKSKCCCIYKKPHLFGESSDEDEDDDCTDSCHGHKNHCYRSGSTDEDSNQNKS